MERFAIVAALLMLLSIGAVAQSNTPGSWEEYLGAADRAMQEGDYARAEQLLRQALADVHALEGDDPLRLRIVTSLANCLVRLERPDEAAALFADGTPIFAEAPLERQCELARVVAASGHRLHQASMSEGADRRQAKQATALLRVALDVAERLDGPDTPDVANLIGALNDSLMGHGNHDERLDLARRHVTIYEDHYGADDPRLIFPLIALADLTFFEDRAEAGRINHRILELYRKHHSEDPKQMKQAYRLLEAYYTSIRDREQAALWGQKAQEISAATQSTKEGESPYQLIVRVGRAEQAEETKASEAYLLQAVETARKAGPEESSYFYTLTHAGMWYLRRKRWDEAELYFAEMFGPASRMADEDPRPFHALLGALSNFEIARGDPEAALEYRLHALELVDRLPAESRLTDLTALTDLYLQMRQYEEAVEAGLQNLELHEELYDSDHLMTANATMRLADLYLALEQDEQAERYVRRTISILEATQGSGSPFLEKYRREYEKLQERAASSSTR